MSEVRHGQGYWPDFGFAAGSDAPGPASCVVVQNDVFNPKACVVNVSQILTVDKAELLECTGKFKRRGGRRRARRIAFAVRQAVTPPPAASTFQPAYPKYPKEYEIPNPMTEVSRILDQLHRAYEGPAWHGPALREILAGVTFETAAQRPIPGAHTIWELVLHLAVWISVPTRRIIGDEIPTLPPDQDWPATPEPSESGWRDALNQLAEAQRNLESEVSQLTDDRLRERVLGEVPYSIYTLLHGVAQHNLYHAGQIALLKKAIR